MHALPAQTGSYDPPNPAVPQAYAIKRNCGLILTGGGARAAYQVGVLCAIRDFLPAGSPNPFPIICGTSAGAINAAVLAEHADCFHQAVETLHRTWGALRVEQVFRSNGVTLYGSAMHWVLALMAGGLGRRNPRSLLDNQPLRELLAEHIQLERIAPNIAQGHLRAVGLTASAYSTGRNVCFYQGAADIMPWQRVRRLGMSTPLSINHIMASLALPFLFPAIRLGGEYYGDGSMRQITPLSHAIHLGAEHLLVIGTRNDDPVDEPSPDFHPPYPSLGKIGGYVLDTLFMDSLQIDAERLERFNQLIQSSIEPPTEADGSRLRRVSLKILLPSQNLSQLAARYKQCYPKAIRKILRGVGGLASDSPLSSYLLFDSSFTRSLMELGYEDTMRQREDLQEFLLARHPHVY